MTNTQGAGDLEILLQNFPTLNQVQIQSSSSVCTIPQNVDLDLQNWKPKAAFWFCALLTAPQTFLEPGLTISSSGHHCWDGEGDGKEAYFQLRTSPLRKQELQTMDSALAVDVSEQ